MGSVNIETVAMMGAALAAGGNVQAQETMQQGDKGTISWNEAQDSASKAQLIADLKAQYPDMGEAVLKMLEGYSLDNLKDVKATLKADGEKLNYMVDGNKVRLNGGHGGKPLNMEVTGQDGSRVQTSQGSTRSSAAYFDENGNLAAHVQKDERTGDMSGTFQADGTTMTVDKIADRVRSQIKSRELQFDVSKQGNRLSMQMDDENLGVLKASARIGANGSVHAKGSFDERDGGEGTYSTASMNLSRNGNMKMNVKSSDEDGIQEDVSVRVGKNGYEVKGVAEDEPINDSGKEVNAAVLKTMAKKFQR